MICNVTAKKAKQRREQMNRKISIDLNRLELLLTDYRIIDKADLYKLNGELHNLWERVQYCAVQNQKIPEDVLTKLYVIKENFFKNIVNNPRDEH